MKIKLNIDIDDGYVYIDTFPNERHMEGKVYNSDLEYYFKFSVNENRFRKIFGQIFSNR